MNDWEEAAEQSKRGGAVAKYGIVMDAHSKNVAADIVKLPGKNGYLVYHRTMRKIRDATTWEVDRTTNWRPWV